MPINLTDAEQTYADSPHGRLALARVKSVHDMREAHRGANARPFTDTMATEATRTLAMQHARSRVHGVALIDAAPAARANADAARITARHVSDERIRNAWKQGR